MNEPKFDQPTQPAPQAPIPTPPTHRGPTKGFAFAITAFVVLVAGIGFYYQFSPSNRGAYKSPTPKPSVTVSPAATTVPYTMSVGPAPTVPLKAPAGYVVRVFADRQGTARDLAFSPGGTLLVSDPKARTVTALTDKNKDGAADSARVVLTGGDNPHGLAFHAGSLYVAETGRVVRYTWNEAALTATAGAEILKLPTPNTNHNKRTITFGTDGRMYVSVGSTCNVCTEADERSATILVADADGKNSRIFAAGLRNAPFMTINPTTSELWATEMGRDNLGDNLPPDEIDIIKDSANYGWPICYGAKIHDTNFDKNTYIRDPCADTIAPTYPVPAHNAPLGLAFVTGKQFPDTQEGDLLVAYHGSWNRTVPDGYKVVRLSVDGNTITGASDFLTGFINGRTVAGRPVDVIFDAAGNLYVSDDKAGAVYIVQKQLAP